MPFGTHFFDAAFPAVFTGTLTITLLKAAPAPGALNVTADLAVPSDALGREAQLTIDASQIEPIVDDAGLWRVTNSATIDFGTAAETITAIGVALSDASGALLGWAPLVDASGCQVTRTFEAGDSIILPTGALSIGVTT